MMNIPRPEYPRPQFVRPSWMNLNGSWQFEIDHGASGRARGLIQKDPLDQRIQVPFCPESSLSGIGYKDFMKAVWYRRSFVLPEEAQGKRVFVHFGAVDYRCEVWVNGQSAGVHEGGYVSFSFEITQALKMGENTLVVCAEDDMLGGRQPYGKQCSKYHSCGCSYTRTTGIWQTVWLEWTPQTFIRSVKLTPDAANGTVYVDALIDGPENNLPLKLKAFYEGTAQAEDCVQPDGCHARCTLKMQEKHLWDAGDPQLYDLVLELGQDRVESYFGLRSICLRDGKCLLNGRPVFQRLILDQGFYPDGVYTAPSDAELKADIERSLAMGFNGARLHEKVFEQRFLYWADHLGYLCWGEMPNWGIDPARPHTMGIFLREWLEVIDRDYNAPSIVGWCPYNEVWGESNDGLRQLTLQMTYRTTKAVDATRPVIDVSGGYHVETDIYDVHDYEQNLEIYAKRYQPGAPLYDQFEGREHYDGRLPRFVSEYGGLRWSDDAASWGYGESPKSPEEFIARYKGLTDALLDNTELIGFCYTQLTDVEQEQNGLYTYNRRAKFPPEVIAPITSRRAAIEE